MAPLATDACPGASAQMNGELDTTHVVHDGVGHVGCEVGRPIRIVVRRSNLRIDEQAKVRIVDLHDMAAPWSRRSSSSRRRIGTQSRTNSSRVGYAFFERSGSHMRSPRRAGAGSVAFIIERVMPRRKAISLAMKPGFLGESFPVTIVHGPTIHWILCELEAVSQLRNDADVRAAPPFAVREDVKPRALLQRDHVADRGLHPAAEGFLGVAGRVVRDQIRRRLVAASSRRRWWKEHAVVVWLTCTRRARHRASSESHTRSA